MRLRLPQFTIRDLFWLIVVAAVASYAYRDRRAVEARMDDQLDKVVAEFALKQDELNAATARFDIMTQHLQQRDEEKREREREDRAVRKRRPSRITNAESPDQFDPK